MGAAARSFRGRLMADRRSRPEPRGLVAAYYLATPLFALVDLVFSFPVRAAAIPDPVPRLFYYAFLLLLGWVCRARPPLAPWVGMGESALLVALLMVSVLGPIWGSLETGELPLPGDVLARTFNLALSGTVLVVAFHRHHAEARRSLGGRPTRPTGPAGLSRSSPPVGP